MNQGKYVFSQIMEFVPYYQFNKCVEDYKGNYRLRNLTCWEQFLAMSFGQLSYRESLRDVVICLGAQKQKIYHLGFRSEISLPTLARINKKRDWRIYRDFALVLIEQAKELYIDDKKFKLDLDGSCYAIDSSTLELCFNVFKWARLVKVRAAVKLHLVLDLQGNIPSFFHISSGKVNDVNFLDMVKLETGAYYVMDRGYLDFGRLFKINSSGSFFVTRAKKNFACKRLYSNKIDKSTNVRCDQIIRLTNCQVKKKYPEKLRRVKYFDQETKKYFVFLTNDFNLDPKTIADIYKQRWQVELFFKWVKQHLKIKSFWGYSENAVKTQICIAISTYLIVAIIKKQLKIERNLYEILQILSVSLFDKSPLVKLISEADLQTLEEHSQKQRSLWDFK